MATIHRLSVDGRDYFLPDPVTKLKDEILQAIRSGGGYVNVPPLRGGPGIDILFSPGMPVTWTQIDVGNDADPTVAAVTEAAQADDVLYDPEL